MIKSSITEPITPITEPIIPLELTKTSLLESIWQDIDHEAEAIVVTDISYNPTSLTNTIYDIIDNREQRRELLKRNKIRGFYADLDSIRQHRNIIENDSMVSLLVRQLFKEEEIDSITALDKVYVNAYYRKILRARIENDLLDKELTPGLIITGHNNAAVDNTVVKSLRLIRVICKFLAIKSTTQEAVISMDKLYNQVFWSSISEKFVPLFGEYRIEPITDPEESTANDEEFSELEVIMLLNVIFNTWSGSTLTIKGDEVKIVPATFVSRLSSKLK